MLVMPSPATKHYITSNQKERVMNMLPKLSLYAAAIVLVIAIILSVVGMNIVAGPSGWLELSQVLAIFAIAIKYILETDKKTV